MWTYLVRRLLVMIPTLFGVTIVSFLIMKLAPGDPLDQQASGGTLSDQQARESYLIRKRELRLDLPLFLNFADFYDYGPFLEHASAIAGEEPAEFQERLPHIVNATDGPDAERKEFIRALLGNGKFADLTKALEDPERHKTQAMSVRELTLRSCEDVGRHGVPPAIALLKSDASSRETKIGATKCLGRMVTASMAYTYSKDNPEEETAAILETWRSWRERFKDELKEPTPERQQALAAAFDELSKLTDRAEIFNTLKQQQRKLRFNSDDRGFYLEKILSESSTLQERATAALVLDKMPGVKRLKRELFAESPPDDVAEVVSTWEAHYGPNRELYEPSLGRRLGNIVADTQYAKMVWRLITFDFGRSTTKTRDLVSERIWNSLKISAPLMAMAEALIYLVAVPVGVFCALYRGKFLDRALALKLFFLYSVPPAVAGMMMLVTLSFGKPLSIFPAIGLHSDQAPEMLEDGHYVGYLRDYLWHAFLPVCCLSLFSLATLAMQARSSMLDVVGQDYIRTARAKGLSGSSVVLKHSLRNAMIPVLTLFASSLPALLGGSALVESIFGIPGMGRLFIDAVGQKDFPILMALIYIDAIIVMLSILLTDILYVFVDPRITFEGQGTRA